jgi:hypothetical protein
MALDARKGIQAEKELQINYNVSHEHKKKEKKDCGNTLAS